MYSKIMTPVDLRNPSASEKALKTAADLARVYGSALCYVSVTPATPSEVAKNPDAFAEELAAFGREQAERFGVQAETKAITSHDPAIDLNETLLSAVKEVGADLVVMASHLPDFMDYVWPSHGGSIAAHSDASVFVVR